jgi:hypothetical protein
LGPAVFPRKLICLISPVQRENPSECTKNYAVFEVLNMGDCEDIIFWDMTQCSLVCGYQHFGAPAASSSRGKAEIICFCGLQIFRVLLVTI